VRQLAELSSLLKADEKVKLYAISVDSQDKNKTLLEKVVASGKGKINFPLLSDPGSKTIDAYGIRDPAYTGKQFDGIPHPAIYIVNKEGKVAWSKIEEDYRKRPANAEIRTELDKTK
jgi:peroxiredoxin